jgi:hypothetical protein
MLKPPAIPNPLLYYACHCGSLGIVCCLWDGDLKGALMCGAVWLIACGLSYREWEGSQPATSRQKSDPVVEMILRN